MPTRANERLHPPFAWILLCARALSLCVAGPHRGVLEMRKRVGIEGGGRGKGGGGVGVQSDAQGEGNMQGILNGRLKHL